MTKEILKYQSFNIKNINNIKNIKNIPKIYFWKSKKF